MRKRIDYIILDIHLFAESFLWTVLDLVRRSRMRKSEAMHKRYKPPAFNPDEEKAEINK